MGPPCPIPYVARFKVEGRLLFACHNFLSSFDKFGRQLQADVTNSATTKYQIYLSNLAVGFRGTRGQEFEGWIWLELET